MTEMEFNEQEIIYDDVYSIPVQNLLELFTPRNIYELRQVLSSNGYYGRHECKFIRYQGRIRHDLTIHITTSYGCFPYRFYPKYDFHMQDSTIRSRTVSRFKYDELMEKALEICIETIASPYTLKNKTGITMTRARSILNSLHRIGLVKADMVAFKDKRDIEEVVNNIIRTI